MPVTRRAKASSLMAATKASGARANGRLPSLPTPSTNSSGAAAMAQAPVEPPSSDSSTSLAPANADAKPTPT